MSTPANSVGARVQHIRKRRGLTQQELAGSAGVSVSLVKKLEQGERADVRVETARKLAAALRVPTTRLLPHHSGDGETDEAGTSTEAAWEPVRRALAGQAPQPEEPPTAAGVRGALRDLAPALTSHRYAAVTATLAALIRDADALDGEPDVRAVHADILTTVGYLLTQTRQFGVAELTLQRAIDAAPDRLAAAAAADTLIWLHLRQGDLAAAGQMAARWADDSEPRLSRATVLELVLWGRFLLAITNAAVRDNRPGDAADALQLAEAAAARIGRDARRHDDSQCVFGPYTVACIRAETHALTGQPDKTLKIAEALPAAPYPELVSRLRHRLDVASACAQLRRYDQAIAAIAEVRARAPEWLAQQRYARDILAGIIEHRRTLTPDMRELAEAVALPL